MAGQHKNGLILAFFPSVSSQYDLKRRVEDAFAYIRASMADVPGLSSVHFAAGVVMENADYESLLLRAGCLCGLWKSSFADTVVFPSGDEDWALLGSGPDEASILVKEILIGVTNFFRGLSFFEKLKYNAVYNIAERADEKDPFRVWSAGCSTDEEACSLAMLFKEVLEELNVQRDIKIFATDVDTKAIEQADRGVENIINDVSSERLAKYFVKKGDQYTISKEIRRIIIFAPHNLLSDPPLWQAGSDQLPKCDDLFPAGAPEVPVCHFPHGPQEQWLSISRKERDCRGILQCI